MRIILAGIAGGIAMFLWSFVSHTVLPLGEVGVKMLPNEPAVMSAMKANISEPGFYFYPGMDMAHDVSAEEQAAWAERYKAGPRGILIYHPTGAEPMGPGMLLTVLLSGALARRRQSPECRRFLPARRCPWSVRPGSAGARRTLALR